jgi:hypothetical protein
MNNSRNTTQDAASEYLPRPEESSNGNGNGHGTIFTLKPALDPDTLAILETRDHALRDQRLLGTMRAFFCLILDRALDPEYYRPHPRGIVTLSDTVLATDFGVSNRTIFTWKRKIEECGDYFWLTRQFRTNMWPITTYHITCLHPPQRGKTDRDGTYGSGRVGRSLPENFPLGARRPGQPGLPLPGSRQKPKAPEKSQTLAIAGLTRNTLPVSPEAHFGSDPKPTSGETRSTLRARPEAHFGRDPKPTSGETRSTLRVRPEADCGSDPKRIADIRETQNGERGGTERTFKRSTLVNAQKAGGGAGEAKTAASVESLLKDLKIVKEPIRPKSAENIFLLDVGAMMEQWRKGSSKAELANSGAWWRLVFRTDHELARKVLAETLRAVKEGQIKQTPGQYAVDLWKRWGGKLP